MLPEKLQETVLTLNQRGMGIRAISRALRISRASVRRILRPPEPKERKRPGEPALVAKEPRLEILVRYLFKDCEGAALRVQQRLAKDYEIEIGYSTLTRFTRELGLRVKRRGGPHPEILTGPGEEMQFDTSPIVVKLGSIRVKLYLANLICGFSRRRYARWFPRWRRYFAKVFLVRALRSLGGVCEVIQIDNGREIVAIGSGADALLAVEMERFAERIGFRFGPVAAGDHDRQGKVEKAHQFVQQNFLKGRRFRDLADLNRQTDEWCAEIFERKVRGQTFAPVKRWEEESAHLKALPVYIPEPSLYWKRRVDDRGRVWLHSSSYRVPDQFVLKWLTLQETDEEIVVLSGRNEVCRHKRAPECERKHSPLPGYPDHKSKRAPSRRQSPEEAHLRSLGPDVLQYLDALEARPIRTSYARMRRLYRFACAYPPEIFGSTLRLALERRAFDLSSLEGVLEEKMGLIIQTACFPADLELAARPAYRKGQVTPHRLRPLPAESTAPSRVEESESAEGPVPSFSRNLNDGLEEEE